MKIFVIK